MQTPRSCCGTLLSLLLAACLIVRAAQGQLISNYTSLGDVEAVGFDVVDNITCGLELEGCMDLCSNVGLCSVFSYTTSGENSTCCYPKVGYNWLELEPFPNNATGVSYVRETGALQQYIPFLNGEFGTLNFSITALTDIPPPTGSWVNYSFLAGVQYWTSIPVFAQPWVPSDAHSPSPDDVPNATFSFVCEIPANSRNKMEAMTKRWQAPIAQDETDGAPRYYAMDILWNYGYLPQTIEIPTVQYPELDNLLGDGDPIDVVDLSNITCAMGRVYEVKVLGAYALIDEGEVDFKVLAINMADPLAESLNNLEDVEMYLPGELEAIKVWFRDYKIPDGKPPNDFGNGGDPIDRFNATTIVLDGTRFFMELFSGARPNTEDYVFV